jgi:shikimate dehydrogenase
VRGRLKRLAVLGHPVTHSRSPAMQNAALQALGLAGEWSYEAIDLDPADFGARVRELAEGDFVGANVTIPHKEAALVIADESSDAASEIGAANTLSFADVIRAENTDAPALLAALPGPIRGKRALLLGAGGSGRAVAWALAGESATVSVWNRTAERAEELVRSLSGTGAGAAPEGLLAPVSTERARANGYEVIVNCTAVGMGEEDPFQELPLDPARFDADVVLVDLVYGGSETRLVEEARGRGAAVVDGLEILVRQGAESLRIWTGLEPPLDVMRKAARDG